MNALMSWFEMHGYAMYIWPAYGLVFGVLITNLVISYRRGRRTRLALRARVVRS